MGIFVKFTYFHGAYFQFEISVCTNWMIMETQLLFFIQFKAEVCNFNAIMLYMEIKSA